MKKKKTYLDGLKRAHEVAMNCLPWPGCGDREKLRRIGSIIGIPIKAIEAEIESEKEK